MQCFQNSHSLDDINQDFSSLLNSDKADLRRLRPKPRAFVLLNGQWDDCWSCLGSPMHASPFCLAFDSLLHFLSFILLLFLSPLILLGWFSVGNELSCRTKLSDLEQVRSNYFMCRHQRVISNYCIVIYRELEIVSVKFLKRYKVAHKSSCYIIFITTGITMIIFMRLT